MSPRDHPAPITIQMLSTNLLEVKVGHEVELTDAHVDTLHQELARLSADRPYALIVDMSNQYSYTFAAMRSILDQPRLFAIALFIQNPVQRASLQTMVSVHVARNDLSFMILQRRADALDWLLTQGAAVDEDEGI